jgi:anti-sigma regulatory factor (Ser/Thr protein kinase)
VGTQLLRHDATCAAQARRCVAEDLRASSICPESVDDVLLVISELVTNAVLHTGTDRGSAADTSDPADATAADHAPVAPDQLGLGWQLREGEITVSVDDADPTPPTPRAAANGDLNGRGLAIVAAIATEWGVLAQRPGKRVWATIPVRLA